MISKISYGQVFEGLHKQSETKVVIKKMMSLDNNSLKIVKKEIDL